MRAIGTSITTLNLEFLIADILKEQKNPISITSKRTCVYRANRTSKDSIRQNKSFKRTKNFKPFNRCRKLNRGSNYNMLLENDDDEAFKDVETEFESDLDLELEFFIIL